MRINFNGLKLCVPDSPTNLGAGSPQFKSGRPDQNLKRYKVVKGAENRLLFSEKLFSPFCLPYVYPTYIFS